MPLGEIRLKPDILVVGGGNAGCAAAIAAARRGRK
ncbi:MAG: FAD-dependent oxidoreductase, partial [Armatimonadota bacterium]